MNEFDDILDVYFETIKCEDYKVYNLDYHNKRISDTIGLNINLLDYIYPPNEKLLRCKVIYDKEGIKTVEFFEYKKREINSFKLVDFSKINYSKKYLNRDILNSLFEKKESADEIIIVKDGFITDTSIANIALFVDDIWITPKKPLLNGTTRQRYLEEKKLFEKNITIDELKRAKKIALMNAMVDFYTIDNYSLLT